MVFWVAQFNSVNPSPKDFFVQSTEEKSMPLLDRANILVQSGDQALKTGPPICTNGEYHKKYTIESLENMRRLWWYNEKLWDDVVN